MSHALLLRLFLSPSFFSVHVALQYLRTYGDHVGITHYLTGRLKGMDPVEVEGLWGLVCHLLVTRPSKSAALECFVLERAEESTHIALLTIWFMQASLADLSRGKRDTPSFYICSRVLNRIHSIIFDPPIHTNAPYGPVMQASRKGKVKPRMGPALVGMGTALAAFGLPELGVVGDWAVKQGRVEEGIPRRPRPPGEDGESPSTPAPPVLYEQGDDLPEEEDPDSAAEAQPRAEPPFTGRSDSQSRQASIYDADPSGTRNLSTVSLELPHTAPIPGARRVSGPHATSPSLPFAFPPRRPDMEDPFGQLDSETKQWKNGHLEQRFPAHIERQHSRFSSSPSISTASRQSADVQLLARYPPEAQTALLKANYFKCQTRFLFALEAISNRLLIVPKPARVSALRAELTNLNHQLPSEVCLPMWCPSTDSDQCRAHHRIVRIPAGECVVLNSAERAPYLLFLEILQGDLDFDPIKRGNKEIVKKLLKEQNQHHTNGHAHTLEDEGHVDLRKLAIKSLSGTQQVALGQAQPEPIPEASVLLPPPALSTIPPTPEGSSRNSLTESPVEDEEEMDLVEQLYGSNISLRAEAIDLADSIVLPTPPKNKALDIATWSRSNPGSPRFEAGVDTTPRRNSNVGVPQRAASPGPTSTPPQEGALTPGGHLPVLSLEDYSERMRTAAVMLAQLNANMVAIPPSPEQHPTLVGGVLSWIPGTSRPPPPQRNASSNGQLPDGTPIPHSAAVRLRLNHTEAAAIKEKIMKEMMSLEEERMQRMSEAEGEDVGLGMSGGPNRKTAEDESIVRRELNKSDPSAPVFKEVWATKKARIRSNSPYGHLASWDCISMIVKTGADLRQEQLATQLIREFERIWREESCLCYARSFRILITGVSSGLVETVTDAVSIHSIKKAEYARRLAEGRFGNVSLMDHFVNSYGDPSSARFVRAQRNFIRSLAGYSVITYLLQIKDRHNGNILMDRDGHLIHIDFGFMLSNSPGGNMGFEAAPFKLPMEYVDILGGIDSKAFAEFKMLFKEGFEAARKHCDRILTVVELMQKDSALPCFVLLGEQTANALRERFQPGLTQSLFRDYLERLIMSSVGSTWTRLYDSYQYYSQSIL
ncbi:kinase-like protein [Calocera cornea HHB12733]|uniref:1-phosphatidylinositol 4-kinase n=1 Tax=Calocera cornea HHB12733 TaxID=1353952 RepID=A0A165H982_9BASI|nr:kinase-like protein [Calocera cornea HHB12733]